MDEEQILNWIHFKRTKIARHEFHVVHPDLVDWMFIIYPMVCYFICRFVLKCLIWIEEIHTVFQNQQIYMKIYGLEQKIIQRLGMDFSDILRFDHLMQKQTSLNQ